MGKRKKTTKELRQELSKREQKAGETEQEYERALQASGKLGICEFCGQKFHKKRKIEQRFCSTEHRLQYWKRKRFTPVERVLECPCCHKKFTTTDKRRVYCSTECYLKVNAQRSKARYE